MNAALIQNSEYRQILYDGLMSARRGDNVEESLALILSSWWSGFGSMPQWLGLDNKQFTNMLWYHFPDYSFISLVNPNRQRDPGRTAEMEELRTLLEKHRSGVSDTEHCLAEIVAVGCQASDHLWQDLGLWCRADLSRLMQNHFSSLAERNNKDMKWKKFLYKQLCETEGIYTCRAPSCEVCADYSNCFGSEK